MKESISQKYKNCIFHLIRLICLWELKVGVLISEVLENKYMLIHILYVASLSFHILLPDAFLGSHYLLMFISIVLDKAIPYQWFHTVNNLEQTVTQKIWISSGFGLSILVLDLHLLDNWEHHLW